MHPLRDYRQSQKMTQQALGEKLGVTGQTIWRWETGSRKVAVKLLPKISTITGIPQRDLRPDLAELMAAE